METTAIWRVRTCRPHDVLSGGSTVLGCYGVWAENFPADVSMAQIMRRRASYDRLAASPSHGENRGSSPLGSANEINYLWFGPAAMSNRCPICGSDASDVHRPPVKVETDPSGVLSENLAAGEPRIVGASAYDIKAIRSVQLPQIALAEGGR